MRNIQKLAVVATVISSQALATDLFAACTVTPTTGGEWRYCENGSCWSRSFWANNRIFPESVESGCF
jgi:hypothetical protein